MNRAGPKSKKQCVNCTCADTGFCPRGVGVNIKRDENATDTAQGKPPRPNANLREQLQKLPQNRKRMRY
ncbi:MAG: hypothetical protein EKK46_06545 [Rhodocyclaceae bacterium]|nr:MAG: hypothetical protein EKK46_06545 [Rhodocyclaceae bacterium]